MTRAYNLWSLWGMLTLKGTEFYAAVTVLHNVTSHLATQRNSNPSYIPTLPLNPDAVALTLSNLGALKVHTEVLEASVTKLAIEELEQALGKGLVTFDDLQGSLFQIDQTLRRELSLVTLLAMERGAAKMYEPVKPLWGDDVQAKFPSISYDIGEAGKCLALGVSTAAAFHSIRCLEAAIRALSRCLGIEDPTTGAGRNWTNLLRDLKAAIDARWPKASDRFTGDGALFEAMHGALTAMQNPYRNSTMHLDQKYMPDEAKHIFEMVCGLMKKIASRMDEKGEPKA